MTVDLSVRTRLVAVAIGLLTLGAVALGGWLPNYLHRLEESWLQERIASLTVIIGSAAAPALDFGDASFAERQMGLLAEADEARWAELTDEHGEVVGTWGTREGWVDDHDHVTIAMPVHARSGASGTVRVGFDTSDLEERLVHGIVTLREGLAVLLVAGFVSAWAAGSILVRPLERLEHEVLAMYQGKPPLPPDPHPYRRDEVRTLTRAFRQMSARVHAHVQELEEERGRAVRAEEEAVRASQAKSVFLANMSHELRTPLNAIIGYAEMLEESAADDAEVADDLGRILWSGRHLLTLINDLLDLAKVEAGHLEFSREPIHIGALVEELTGQLGPDARRLGNTMTVEGAAQVGVMYGDAMRLRQCLFNLLSNAVKFTRDGEIRVVLRDADDAVVFEVADTGIGMEPAALERIFRPFEQAERSTARRFGGTGLGLALTRVLVEGMGGTVGVRSALGRGSTFTITLPRARGSHPRTPSHPVP